MPTTRADSYSAASGGGIYAGTPRLSPTFAPQRASGNAVFSAQR